MTEKKLTILHTESSTGWAGQEMRIILEAREMKKRGHRIIIAAQPGSGIIPAVDREGFEKKILYMRKKDLIGSVFSIMNIIAAYRVDIVNTHSSWDSWVASIAGRISRSRPAILRTRHLSTPVSTGFLSRIVYQYLPHIVITTGDFIRDRLVNYNGFPAKKIISIPTGVDQEVFYPRPLDRELRRTLGIADEEKAVAEIAALRSWKGHDHLLEAAKLLTDRKRKVRFIIAGDGPRRGHLEEKAASLGISDKVLFLGHRDDVDDILSAVDIVALPSYANEGVPQAVLQAMAMEKPVVSTTAGSIPEIIRDRETGVLTEPKNPASLAEGIELLLDNEDMAKTLAMNAKKLIDAKYSLKHMVSKMEEAYDLVLKRKSGAMNNG